MWGFFLFCRPDFTAVQWFLKCFALAMWTRSQWLPCNSSFRYLNQMSNLCLDATNWTQLENGLKALRSNLIPSYFNDVKAFCALNIQSSSSLWTSISETSTFCIYEWRRILRGTICHGFACFIRHWINWELYVSISVCIVESDPFAHWHIFTIFVYAYLCPYMHVCSACGFTVCASVHLSVGLF